MADGPQEPQHNQEKPRQREPEPAAYLRAARFTSERTAARVYRQAQDAIHSTPCDLSVYRFLLDQVTHVAAVGAPPPTRLDQTLTCLLATGIPAALPAEVQQALLARREQARRLGPWVEGHYRPGKRLSP